MFKKDLYCVGFNSILKMDKFASVKEQDEFYTICEEAILNLYRVENDQACKEQNELYTICEKAILNLHIVENDQACKESNSIAVQLPLDEAYMVDTKKTENQLDVINPIVSDGITTLYECNQDALMSVILALVFYLCNSTVACSFHLLNCFSAMKTHVLDTDYGLKVFLCKANKYTECSLNTSERPMDVIKDFILKIFEIDIYDNRCPIFITGDKESGFGLNLYNIFFAELVGDCKRKMPSTDLIRTIDRVIRDKPRRLYCMDALEGLIRLEAEYCIKSLIVDIYNNKELLTESNIKDLLLYYNSVHPIVRPAVAIRTDPEVLTPHNFALAQASRYKYDSFSSTNTLHNFCSRICNNNNIEFTDEQIGVLTFKIIESLKSGV